MKRLLFVDDEPRILDGLRRQLRGMRTEWEMTFANGGAEAIAKLAEQPFDVLVTDMRMPGVDGAALLEHSQQHHPGMVRIVLSGHTEFEAAMRALPNAHQFLGKPCEPDTLRAAVERCCRLQSLLNNSKLRAYVGDVRDLPVAPDVYHRVTAAMQRSDVSIGDISQLVLEDPAICAEVLKIVNSGFFGLQRTVSGIAEAVTFLGLSALRDLVLTAGVFRQIDGRADSRVDLRQFRRHATLTANLARQFAGDGARGQEAFTAGMLHDLGTIICGDDDPEVGHAEVGGFLLGMWGLSFRIVEAVRSHHAPTDPEDPLAAVLHAAQAMAHGMLSDIPLDDLQLDRDYLQRSGLAQRLPELWQQACEIAAVL